MSNSCDTTAVKSVSLECLCDAVDYATEVLRGGLSPDLDSTSKSNHALSKNYSNFQKIFGKFESFLSRPFYKKCNGLKIPENLW